MSTIKSSAEDLTLNADGSGNDIKFQSNAVEKASISSAGAFTSTTIDATVLTGALPAIDGSSLTGISSVGGATGVDFNDDVKARFGTGNDLEIYHDGSHSYIKDNGTGMLLLDTNGDRVRIQAVGSEELANFNKDGNVELFYDNSMKFETTDIGIKVTGGINIADNRGIAIGDNSQASDVSGSQNIAIGPHTLMNNTTSKYNTAVGYQAMRYCEVSGTNGYNTAIGRQALQGVSSGYSGGFNVGVGCSTGYAMTSAAGNVMVGYASGYELSSGDSNVLLGTNAGRGATSPVGVSTSDGIICLGNNNTTSLYCADTSISSSDQRDKADIEDFTAGLSFVNQMRPVTYRWDKRSWYINQETGTIEDVLNAVPDGTHKKTKQHVGFLSQEIEVLEKEIGFATSKDNQLFCNTNPDDIAMGLKYERLIPVLVNAIKELSAKCEDLQAQIDITETE